MSASPPSLSSSPQYCEPPSSTAHLHALLLLRAENYISVHGRKPTREDIASDAEWQGQFMQLQELELSAAEPRREGGCCYYIKRRRRYCTNFVTVTAANHGLCTRHEMLSSGYSSTASASASAAAGEDESKSCQPMPEPDLMTHVSQVNKRKKVNLSRRMKKMSNPCAAQFQSSTPAPAWDSVFLNSALPLFLDIGSAKGKFIKNLSESSQFRDTFGAMNFLGVELFESLVVECNEKFVKTRRNLHYVASNINVSYTSLAFPNLTRISIQFPDPWFEPKKRGRRVVNAELALWASRVATLKEVFLVSDVLELAREMRDTFLDTGCFVLHESHQRNADDEGGQDNWLTSRPYVVPTERDLVCETLWRPVYRTFLVKVD